MSEPIRVAIVGAGPAGFFLADKLLSQTAVAVAVDLFERLPTPYGLVRFGVAPDHEKIKLVTRAFDKVATKPGFRFFGNVEIGRHLSVAELRRHYHAVAFTTGAQTDRRMGIPGEDLAGSHPATEFVAWYNGHPDYADRTFNLDAERVAVVGVGNVAVDVARILAKTTSELATTDIADHALEALGQSKVKEVYLLGRRGPVQAAFTTPEVKELGELTDADAICIEGEVALDPASAAALASDDDVSNRRKVDVLAEYARRGPGTKPKRLVIRFLVSPLELIGDESGRVTSIRLAKNRLVEKDGRVVAVPTGEEETIPVDLVFRSVGYKGVAIEGLPFDPTSGTIPNQAGRVEPGLYVAGWIKRGPSGVIGTNKPDAGETADAIVADAQAEALAAPGAPIDELDRLIATRQPDAVTWNHWVALGAHETAAGKPAGRPRAKLVRVADMLAAIKRA